MASVDEFELRITDAVDAFRDGLVALIPAAERIALTWRDQNSHDDWERLAEALFEVFVASPVALDALNRRRPSLPLPRYDFDYDDYSQFSWLELDDADEDKSLVFIRLLSRPEPFAMAQVVPLDSDGRALGERVLVPHADLRLRLRRRFGDGSSRVSRRVLLDE